MPIHLLGGVVCVGRVGVSPPLLGFCCECYLEERAPLGLMPQLQAQLLARHLRGDLDGYPPFVWR